MKEIPGDYYRRLAENEESHWWSRGMREVTAALLADVVGDRTGLELLDAGCGAGGFLAWAAGQGGFERLAGTDISVEALELARARVPFAELRLAPLHRQPFDDDSFDVAVLHDVLQHVDESEVQPALRELLRVLRHGGHLVVRTNAGRRARRERNDWRLYDAAALRRELEDAGFRVVRLTHANAVPALWASLRRRPPRAPSATACGFVSPPGRIASAIAFRLLDLEARYIRATGRSLPFGHSLVGVGQVPPEPQPLSTIGSP